MDRLDQLEKRVDQIDGRLGRIEGDVSTIKTTLATIDSKIEGKVEALRADIHKAIAENHKWTHTATIGMFSAFILGVFGLLFTIYNASKPASTVPASQSAPIIIQVPQAAPVAAPPIAVAPAAPAAPPPAAPKP